MNFLIIQTKQEPSPVKKTVPANMTVMYMIHFYSGIALALRALKEYIKQHRVREVEYEQIQFELHCACFLHSNQESRKILVSLKK